jgi:pseudouridine-5'-phosphate glycosidase
VDALRMSPVIQDALHGGTPVVALESTVLTHGLPPGANVEAAHAIEAAVREAGAVPATIAMLEGVAVVGLTTDQIEQLADRAATREVGKAGSRDLPIVAASRAWASTTVGATCVLARVAGIVVFATGGIGGVHRDAATSFDESADLVDLARTGRLVVSAGIKSLLDVAATMQRLETLGVPVVGYRTDTVPGFWTPSSAVSVPHRLDDAETVAAAFAGRAGLGLHDRSLLVFQAVDAASGLAPDEHDLAVADALADAAAQGMTGPDVTPFVLHRVHQRTGGASVQANTALLVANARLAALLATHLAQLPHG